MVFRRITFLLLPAALSALFLSASVSHAEEEYNFRFNPPDGIRFERKVETEVTEWQIFNVEEYKRTEYSIAINPRRRAIGIWATDYYPKSQTWDQMLHAPLVLYDEDSNKTKILPPGKRKWKDEYRTSVSLSASADGCTATHAPMKCDLESESLTRSGVVANLAAADTLTYQLSSDGRLAEVVCGGANAGLSDSGGGASLATFGGAESIQEELSARWRRQCSQWVGRTVSVGDMFASIDTVILAIPEVCSVIVYCVSFIDEGKGCGKNDCLRIIHSYDADANKFEEVMDTSFWDIYDGDFMPVKPERRIVVFGQEELTVDPGTMLVYAEESMCQVKFLKPFEAPTGPIEDKLIHVHEERSKVKYKY